MDIKKRWLVLAHEATNSGAPRMLLAVLRATRLAHDDRLDCEILFDRGGALEGEFARSWRTHHLSHPWAAGRKWPARILRVLIDRPWLKPRRLRKLVMAWRAGGPGIIYSNTATNGRLLAALPPNVARIVTHVHELGEGLKRFNRPQDLAATLTRTDFFLAVSTAVAADLLALGVPANRIKVMPDFLSVLPPKPEPAQARAELCQKLGLSLETRLIVGCGYVDPIKGTDLFVDMAARLAARIAGPLTFLWLGRDADPEFARRVRIAAPVNVRFVGEVEDASAYFAAAEIVTITSRIESFSLVALEAGSLGRPVLAYAAARGPADLLGPEALVPELDAEAMAQAVEKLLRHPEEARQQGLRLRERIANNFLAEHWTAQLVAAIEG